MGSKSSNAPAPDPRLIEAQIRSMGYQDDAINSILQNSKDMAPLQKQQMQFGLDSAKTAYDQSQEDRKYALGRRGVLTGLQDKAVSDAANFNEAGRQDQLVHEAQGDVNAAFSSARSQGLRSMERMGVNPNSGKFAAMGNQTAIAQAAALASASNKTRQAARTEGYALKDRASNMLSGYPAMGMQTTGSGAGFGSSGIGLSNTSLAGLNSGASSAGGLASQLGGNASSMYGQQVNYQNAVNNANGDGGAGMVVGLASAAATAF